MNEVVDLAIRFFATIGVIVFAIYIIVKVWI